VCLYDIDPGAAFAGFWALPLTDSRSTGRTPMRTLTAPASSRESPAATAPQHRPSAAAARWHNAAGHLWDRTSVRTSRSGFYVEDFILSIGTRLLDRHKRPLHRDTGSGPAASMPIHHVDAMGASAYPYSWGRAITVFRPRTTFLSIGVTIGEEVTTYRPEVDEVPDAATSDAAFDLDTASQPERAGIRFRLRLGQAARLGGALDASGRVVGSSDTTFVTRAGVHHSRGIGTNEQDSGAGGVYFVRVEGSRGTLCRPGWSSFVDQGLISRRR